LINGLFFDFDTIISFVYIYSSLGLNIVISATFPFSITPLSIFINLAGLYEVNFTNSRYVKSPVSIRFIISAGNAVSNPIIPFGAFAKPCPFSSLLCGAWSVIIASIVQMETRSPNHMAMVAGIIYNRLNNGLPLQMDSTREYINNYVTDNPLLGDTSKYAALFNTYKCQALPAGPICSPGADAINAVRNPAQTDALYFFFGKDNENHYSVTYEEHQAAIAQFGVQYE